MPVLRAFFEVRTQDKDSPDHHLPRTQPAQGTLRRANDEATQALTKWLGAR